MPMITRLTRMVTYDEELPPKNCVTPHGGGHVRSRDKLNRLHFHLQKTHRHQIRQGVELSFCIHKNSSIGFRMSDLFLMELMFI